MPLPRNSLVVLLSLGLLVAGAACGDGEARSGGFTMPPTPVEAATIAPRHISDVFTTVGTIEANTAVVVVSEIAGIVESLPFEEGEPVARGDLLVELEDSQLAAEVVRAEAVRDQALNTFRRVERIVESDVGTKQNLDDAAAELKVAEANLALARTRLAKTRIRAPFSGEVGVRRISPGAFVQPGTPITELTSIDTLKVTFSAPERYVAILAAGTEVEVGTTAFPDLTLKGSIDVVEPALDAATRNIRIVARVKNPEQRFRPGMSADVRVVLAERAEALAAPSEAVFAEGDQFLVYRITDEDTVERTPVTLGTRLPGWVEILDGLQAGDRVVRAGHQKLHDGAKVAPVATQPDSAAPSAEDA